MNHILYTVKEVGEILKASRRSVLSWIYAGRLKAIKIGGGRLWRVGENDLHRFIEGKPSKKK